MQVNGRRSSPAHASMSFGLIFLFSFTLCPFYFLYTFKHLLHTIFNNLRSLFSPFVCVSLFLSLSFSLFIFIYNIHICICIHIYIYILSNFFVCHSYSHFIPLVLSVHVDILSIFRASTGFASFLFLSFLLMYMPAKLPISLIFH